MRTKRVRGVTISSISAPWLQATMLEQAELKPGMRCLEIGSGGFNAALMADACWPAGLGHTAVGSDWYSARHASPAPGGRVDTGRVARMKGLKTGTSIGGKVIGTPFGGFDDANAQWSTLQTATNGMSTSLATLQQKLATLRAGTEAIMKNYQDAEARNATSAAQINALLDQKTAIPTGSTTPSPNV